MITTLALPSVCLTESHRCSWVVTLEEIAMTATLANFHTTSNTYAAFIDGSVCSVDVGAVVFQDRLGLTVAISVWFIGWALQAPHTQAHQATWGFAALGMGQAEQPPSGTLVFRTEGPWHCVDSAAGLCQEVKGLSHLCRRLLGPS